MGITSHLNPMPYSLNYNFFDSLPKKDQILELKKVEEQLQLIKNQVSSNFEITKTQLQKNVEDCQIQEKNLNEQLAHVQTQLEEKKETWLGWFVYLILDSNFGSVCSILKIFSNFKKEWEEQQKLFETKFSLKVDVENAKSSCDLHLKELDTLNQTSNVPSHLHLIKEETRLLSLQNYMLQKIHLQSQTQSQP